MTVPYVVLIGGGVESTTLVQQLLHEGRKVQPLYVHWGLTWEETERRYVRRFCDSLASERLLDTIEIHSPHRDVLPDHWAVTGRDVPRAGESHARLEIPVRNLSLLTAATARFSHLPELFLVLGTTADNRYNDGTRTFFDRCEEILSLDRGRSVHVLTPFIDVDKSEVIRRADNETLRLSFSCIDPRSDQHCGACYKCGRRREAFAKASRADPTFYVN